MMLEDAPGTGPDDDVNGTDPETAERGRKWGRFQPGVSREDMPEVPDPDFAGFMFNKAVMAYELMRAQWRRRLGLNTHERLALEHLWDGGTLSMGELGSRLALSRAAITSLIDRMEAMGYVERASDPLDRRRTLITGRVEIAKERIYPMAATFGREVAEFAKGLSEEEWQAVVGFMDAVMQASRTNAAQWSSLDEGELRRTLDEGLAYEE